MKNEQSAVAEVPVKRKYTRRNSFVSDGDSGSSIRLHGIPLEVDPECIKRMKERQVTEREKEFRHTVLAKFEAHIAELKQDIQETGEVPEQMELPATLGTASADFSSTPTVERVLVPGNDYAIRVHVGLMALMEWTAKQIAAMEKEIVSLKSTSAQLATAQPQVEAPAEIVNTPTGNQMAQAA